MSLSRSHAHHFCLLAEAQRWPLRDAESPRATGAEYFGAEVFSAGVFAAEIFAAAVFGPLNELRTT
jgi:hypothetical protein